MQDLDNIKIGLYATNDLSLAATLVTWGFSLRDIDKSDSKKALFVFENNETIQEHIKSYWGDLIPVMPKKLLTTLKELKSQIYADRMNVYE